MEFSPSDIRNSSFSKSLRGFSAEEVNTFLEKVADQVEALQSERDDLSARVDTLEEKLNAIGDAASKVKSAKARVDELQEKAEEAEARLREEQEALAKRRRAIESKHDAILNSVARLREAVQSETEKLSSIASGDGAAGSDAPTLSSEPKREKKSTQEWIDSLFPNRLGSGRSSSESTSSSGSTAEASAETAETPSAPRAQRTSPSPNAQTPDEATEARRDDDGEETLPGPSHFEAIKQDVQRMETSDGDRSSKRPSSNDDDGGPSTNELERIWDIFDKQG